MKEEKERKDWAYINAGVVSGSTIVVGTFILRPEYATNKMVSKIRDEPKKEKRRKKRRKISVHTSYSSISAAGTH